MIAAEKNCIILKYLRRPFLAKIYFDSRETIWSDADQSGIDISSIKIPVHVEQENSSSINVRRKILHYVSFWWNVAAD